MLCAAQQYLSLMMKPEDPVTVVKFKGVHHVDTTDTDANTFLTPKTG